MPGFSTASWYRASVSVYRSFGPTTVILSLGSTTITAWVLRLLGARVHVGARRDHGTRLLASQEGVGDERFQDDALAGQERLVQRRWNRFWPFGSPDS